MSCSIVALLVLGTLGVASATVAADSGEGVTFHEDVLATFQENCQTCPRPGSDNVAGMVALMSLMTYEEEAKLAEYPLDVGRGTQSADEMMAPFLAWTYVEPEDAAAIHAVGSAGSTGDEQGRRLHRR